MTNITKLPVRPRIPEGEELAGAIYVLLNEYASRLTMATIVGILEMVKADVLDSMKGE